MSVKISDERAEQLFQSEIGMKLIKSILVALDSGKWSFSENRPDLDIHTGHVGDTVIEITLNHPEHGEIKISGKNFV